MVAATLHSTKIQRDHCNAHPAHHAKHLHLISVVQRKLTAWALVMMVLMMMIMGVCLLSWINMRVMRSVTTSQALFTLVA